MVVPGGEKTEGTQRLLRGGTAIDFLRRLRHRCGSPDRQTAALDAPATATAPGDVDCDGTVTSIDAELVLQYVAGLTASLSYPEAGDVDGDGETTSVDAALILQRVAGKL